MRTLPQFRDVAVLPRLRFNLFAFLIILCLVSSSRMGFGQAAPTTSPGKGPTERVRIAEGEYKVLSESGIGPFLPAVYGFDEAWTLWRLADGSFEVTGTRSYRSPSFEPHSHEFAVSLSSDFQVRGLTEFRRLRWRPDSGPLRCDFLPSKLACTSNAKDANQNVSLSLPVKEPFGFMWPISAFSLASITRTASRDPRRAIPVDLVRIEEASKEEPVLATILSGDLKYLGLEELSLADRKWQAEKFELKVPLHAPFLIWTSSGGLLLGFAPENDSKSLSGDGLKLVSFRQWLWNVSRR